MLFRLISGGGAGGDALWLTTTSMLAPRSCSTGVGSQNDALVFSGFVSGAESATSESFNGLDWTSEANCTLTLSRRAGAGSPTAALAFGGRDSGGTQTDASESYDGTAWGAESNMPYTTSYFYGAGLLTAALAIGGVSGSDGITSTSEFDGTTWTASAALNTKRYGSVAGGNTSDAFTAGGGAFTSGIGLLYRLSTEEYNGTVWTLVGDLLTATIGGAGGGPTGGALYYGGSASTGRVVTTQQYNGTTWATAADMNTARSDLAGAGNRTSALAAGSSTGSTSISAISSAEVYGAPSSGLTGWTAASVMPIARGRGATSGGHATTFTTLGNTDQFFSAFGLTASTCIYDGSTWSVSANVAAARYLPAGAGDSTAGLAFCGFAPFVGSFDETDEFNGVSWSLGGSYADFTFGVTGFGTQIAAVGFGGGGITKVSKEYNGATWVSGALLTLGREFAAGIGQQLDGMACGGLGSPTGTTASVELYDGASWVTGPSLLFAVDGNSGAGESTLSAITFGGALLSGATTNQSQTFDGVSWSISKPLTTARRLHGGSGNTGRALASGGGDASGGPCFSSSETYYG